MRTGDSDDFRRLAQVCAAYGLGQLRAARFLPLGLINRNWRVDTTTGAYAVKELRDPIATGVREQCETVRLLMERGVPIPQPLERAGGDPVYAVDGAQFTVTAWAPGEHLNGPAMSLGQATAFGDLLGRIHVALADVLGPGEPAPAVAVRDPAQAVSYLDSLLETIGRKAERDAVDEVALADLAWRRTILTDPALSMPPNEDAGPKGYIHGDFHHNNVLWSDGRISAVLDWDRVRVHSLAREVIRTCLLAFGGNDIDLARTAAFVRGYRRRRPLTDGDLADAEGRQWWSWLTGFWPLDWRHERGITTFDELYVYNASTLRWWTGNRSHVIAAVTGRGDY